MQCIVGRAWGSCVVVGGTYINSYAQYTACLQCVYMHNKENLKFMQIHAAEVRAERPALISLPVLRWSAYAGVSVPHIKHVLSSVVACLPHLAMILLLFCKYSEYLCSLQIAKQLHDCKSATRVFRSRAHWPYVSGARVYPRAMDVRTIYICIYIHISEKFSRSTH